MPPAYLSTGRPKDFDLALFWHDASVQFEAGLRPKIAQLRATTIGLTRIAKLGAYAANAVDAQGPLQESELTEGAQTPVWRLINLPYSAANCVTRICLNFIRVSMPQTLPNSAQACAEIVHSKLHVQGFAYALTIRSATSHHRTCCWSQRRAVRWKLDLKNGLASPENAQGNLKNFSVPVKPMLGGLALAPVCRRYPPAIPVPLAGIWISMR